MFTSKMLKILGKKFPQLDLKLLFLVAKKFVK